MFVGKVTPAKHVLVELKDRLLLKERSIGHELEKQPTDPMLLDEWLDTVDRLEQISKYLLYATDLEE